MQIDGVPEPPRVDRLRAPEPLKAGTGRRIAGALSERDNVYGICYWKEEAMRKWTRLINRSLPETNW